ncbi:hypothetical protein Hypma_002545 [Hypsizygus marmoreus]|uniref:Uncharacterized protein n=1 Tax=Hypsizygus marmoreus TaxID=39966 RepID=A0A369J682_HYPMA|nr:hypothetical protein Hypma_002545 [Hypsizygus marmoreus]
MHSSAHLEHFSASGKQFQPLAHPKFQQYTTMMYAVDNALHLPSNKSAQVPRAIAENPALADHALFGPSHPKWTTDGGSTFDGFSVF